MSMESWARKEVRIACEREASEKPADEWDYGCACYESALKAYLSVMNDDHSGMSYSITVGILKRLLEGKPLTPIEDVPEVWNDVSWRKDGTKDYQCNRMTSLFKQVKADGSVKYSDTRRYYCEDIESGITYTCGLEANMLDELHPITMPYFPPAGNYVFMTRELLTDRKNGDFDTKAILTLRTPDGKVEDIYRYFAETKHGWQEIDLIEYGRREEADKQRREQEDNHVESDA